MTTAAVALTPHEGGGGNVNRQRWMRTRRRLERRVVDRTVEQFRRDTQPMVERALFFGEQGPEEFGPAALAEREVAAWEREGFAVLPNGSVLAR
jgi:hypothetical protein